MNPAASDNLSLDPILPVPVLVGLAAVLLFLTVRIYLRVGWSVGRWRNLGLLLFRVAGLGLVLLLLLQPSRREYLTPPVRERVTVVALDTSLSMKQRDVAGQTRLDAAKGLLLESGVVARNGVAAKPQLRLFEFSDDARPLVQSVLDATAQGKSTRLHKSLSTMLNASAAGEALNALIVLSDGHDFELVNPAKTGAAARSRQVPLYAVAFGKQGKVRDVAVRMANYQPYCYVKQKARLNVALRLIGCELEDITVQLLRQGKLVQSKQVNAGEAQELPVEFEVAEPAVGQYEYEVRVQPLEHETDAANNSAISYLNVIDQQIRVLVLEGDPYWDTTFLQRSLMRNDKFDVDSLLRYGKSRVRAIRKTPSLGELRTPETAEQFAAYDIIVLGRAVEQVLNPAQIGALSQSVRERGTTVIFSRGPAFPAGSAASELEPVLWGERNAGRQRLEVTSEGRNLAAFRALNEQGGGVEGMPELLGATPAREVQPLGATLALATGAESGVGAPAVVHRRFGSGQVVSLGVEGLWRWGLNAKVEGINAPFDRFWDQMILWLLAGRDFIPNRQFSFRPNSANILLGEKIHFRLTMRQPDPKVKTVPLTLYYGEAAVGRVNLAAAASDATKLTAEYLPERTGRYRAVASFPDGTSQESRFIVFTENLEETEVATDTLCLRRLCESSGGRLLEPADLGRLLQELEREKADVTPKTRLVPAWNQPWVFYLAGGLLGLDWFLRRRWGLC